MSLVLTLAAGKDFYVEDTRVEVSSVVSPTCFHLRLDNGDEFKVTDAGWTDILLGVRVQSALEKPRWGHTARVVIDAPGLRILRGDARSAP